MCHNCGDAAKSGDNKVDPDASRKSTSNGLDHVTSRRHAPGEKCGIQMNVGSQLINPKYPSRIYVQLDNPESEERDAENLMPWKDPKNANDGEVAIYQLVRVTRKRSETIIE